MSIPGAIRFNTDSMKLEYYRGGPVGFGTTTQTGEWVNLTTDSPDIQTGGARGLFAGGSTPDNVIQYVTISTTGNAQDFGDLTVPRYELGACSSSTRGVFGGGWTPSGAGNVIDYVTISSTGNAIDYGDLTTPRNQGTGCSNSTRGIFGAGFNPIQNTIDYITITSTGNAKDFGDLTVARSFANASASSTRGLFFGGATFPSPVILYNIIDFITISTLGNAADFGDLTIGKWQGVAVSNSTRSVFGGGYIAPATLNTIDYVTISTLGNATDFGDLTVARRAMGGASSSTRGVWAGGVVPSPAVNTIDYVTIMSIGNAIDFGDLNSFTPYAPAGLSNGHGGLG